MPAPVNAFKQSLADGRRSIGCWMGLCDPYAAEIVARAGFDWVLIDGEHAPNDLPAIARQLQVTEPHCAPIVRLPMAEPWLIKQVLDAGAQSLLIPMVNSAEDARAIVRAIRYPPGGIRGVGHALGRASRFGRVPDYAATAEAELCLVVQIESRAAVDALEAILAVDGVDAAFVGPSDLAADMGMATDSAAVRQVVADTLRRIRDAGKPAGIIDLDDAAMARHLADGAQFVAVAADVIFLSQGLGALAARWRAETAP